MSDTTDKALPPEGLVVLAWLAADDAFLLARAARADALAEYEKGAANG